MIDLEEFRQTPMGQAVIELSERMEQEHIPPVSLNVIGGFALMMRKIRDPNGATDIDYVGNPLPPEFDQIADEIGLKYNLGQGWINNDVMLSDNTFEDFEFSTGELHFEPALSIGNININVLEEEDLLRMKLIAIDTGLIATEVGGDFTRMKDLPDAVTLMNLVGVTCDDLMPRYGEYIKEATPTIIGKYINHGIKAVEETIDQKTKAYRDALSKSRQGQTYKRSPLVQDVLTNLLQKSEGKTTPRIDRWFTIDEDEP